MELKPIENTKKVNDIIGQVNTLLSEARKENQDISVRGAIDPDHGEFIIIAVTPEGNLFGQYFHMSAPVYHIFAKSPRELSEALCAFIENFYELLVAMEEQYESNIPERRIAERLLDVAHKDLGKIETVTGKIETVTIWTNI